jgi:excisionase family DNA binding protein
MAQRDRHLDVALLREETEIGLMLTVSECAAILRISGPMVYKLIRLERLPVIRHGRRIVIERDELVAYLERCKSKSRSRRTAWHNVEVETPAPIRGHRIRDGYR